ncbi:hypothetical protein [Streptomyces sp. NPDC054887]
MTTPVVAHLLTALRALRRVGRRRALRVVLFLGGLMALGFLWGGQAHAVETPLPQASAAAVDAPATTAPTAPTVPAVQAVTAVVEASVAPVTAATPVTSGAPVDPVDVRAPRTDAVREVVEPVAEAVRTVTRPVGEVQDRLPGHLPAVPGVPALPVPGLPAFPGLPELPGPDAPSGPPASTPPTGAAADSPVDSAASVRIGSGDPTSRAAGRGDVTGAVAVAEQGAYPYGAFVRQHDGADGGPGRAECGEAPVPAPSGPCGDGMRQTAGDGNSARSGDRPTAAITSGGARFGLVRGATLPATAAPTYDRPHEILEFPG